MENLEKIMENNRIFREHYIEYGRYLERNGLEDNIENEENFNVTQEEIDNVRNFIDRAINGCGLVHENLITEEIGIYDDTDSIRLLGNRLRLNKKTIVIKNVDEFQNHFLINKVDKLSIL